MIQGWGIGDRERKLANSPNTQHPTPNTRHPENMPWQPKNKYSWDSWYFQHGSTLHAFYLQASQVACRYIPDKRHGLASIGHAIFTDFGWKEVDPNQPTFEKNAKKGWDDLVTWTGSIIEKDGVYYLFYTGKSKDAPLIDTPQERRHPQDIGVATSKDFKIWKRTPATLKGPVIPNPGINSEFDGCNWRDPYLIQDDRDGKYYAFICARPQNSLPDQGGVIAYATSKDLENWQEEPYRVLYQSDEYYLTETPQVFWRRTNDGKSWRLYVLFGPHWSSFFVQSVLIGVTCYVRSVPIEDRSQISYDRIPWEDEKANILCNYLYAGKLINPEETTPLFYGFQKEDEAGHFVGGISDPQWAIFADDGTISLSDSQPR